MFVAPIWQSELANINLSGGISSSPLLNQEGFSQSTTFNATSNNYLTPAVAGQPTLSNPFPSGILQPAGSAQGLATYVGQNVSLIRASR